MTADDTKTCPLCNGAEYTLVEEGTQRQCLCAYARQLKSHLGPELALAPTPKRSPLYVVNKKGAVTDDKTGSNLMITGHWEDIKSHLKWALGCKGTSFRFRITNDERLKTIFVGAEAYTAKARKKREDVETYNSLHDFVGPDFHLVIIRLGFLGYRNVAMPGVLKETIMIRDALNLPTWIIEDATNPFPNTHAYSPDTAEYIDRSFNRLDLTTDRPNAPRVGASDSRLRGDAHGELSMDLTDGDIESGTTPDPRPVVGAKSDPKPMRPTITLEEKPPMRPERPKAPPKGRPKAVKAEPEPEESDEGQGPEPVVEDDDPVMNGKKKFGSGNGSAWKKNRERGAP